MVGYWISRVHFTEGDAHTLLVTEESPIMIFSGKEEDICSFLPKNRDKDLLFERCVYPFIREELGVSEENCVILGYWTKANEIGVWEKCQDPRNLGKWIQRK